MTLPQLRGSQGEKNNTLLLQILHRHVILTCYEKQSPKADRNGTKAVLDTLNRETTSPNSVLKEKTLKPFRVEDCVTVGKGLKHMG